MIDLFLMPRLAPELPETDILLPNAAEARHLAGVDSPIVVADEAMAHVSRNGKTS